MTEIINALLQERSQLEAELRNDSRYLKVQRINELLATYDGGIPQKSVELAPSQPAKSRDYKERPKTKGELIKQEIRTLLLQKGTAHRSQILARLMERGLIKGSKKHAMQTMAMYLSVSKDMFISDGAGNYRLREEIKALAG